MKNAIGNWIDWPVKRYSGVVTFLTYKRHVIYRNRSVVVHLHIDSAVLCCVRYKSSLLHFLSTRPRHL